MLHNEYDYVKYDVNDTITRYLQYSNKFNFYMYNSSTIQIQNLIFGLFIKYKKYVLVCDFYGKFIYTLPHI